MILIEITSGAFVVSDAIGAFESTCERFDGSGVMEFRTVVRSKTSEALFVRKDSVKLSDGQSCENVRLQHASYIAKLKQSLGAN